MKISPKYKWSLFLFFANKTADMRFQILQKGFLCINMKITLFAKIKLIQKIEIYHVVKINFTSIYTYMEKHRYNAKWMSIWFPPFSVNFLDFHIFVTSLNCLLYIWVFKYILFIALSLCQLLLLTYVGDFFNFVTT